ncbi:hypothetical protein [Thioflexithrix psekupsensis]|uniref:Uncharacterized protein n=1 Tax=Thioflexithrix psekupsensis TaxID=1570016 RepID=A0A251XAG6_9GAMM|nr:hypothetical protein [Thioflexithrix psekupsensis]OUD15028.1 hypothetical protein TPSD3_04845 [Thioflexithrix psekupsensis]
MVYSYFPMTYPIAYPPVSAPVLSSSVKRAAWVGAVMGAAGATASHLKNNTTPDAGLIGDILAGAVAGSLATAGVTVVSEGLGVKNPLSNSAVMFLTGTALLYVMQNRSA